MTKKLSPTAKAVRKIIRFASKGKLGAKDDSGCVYHNEDTNRFCAIGCLLPKETLALVKKKNLNVETGAFTLYNRIPKLEKTIGLSEPTATAIQLAHDEWATGETTMSDFINFLQQVESRATGQ